MSSAPNHSGLSITGLIMVGLSVFTSLLLIALLMPPPPGIPPGTSSGSPYTGSYILAAGLLLRVIVLVAGGGVDLVFTVMAVVFGAIGATRSHAPWQRVSFWVCLPFVVLAFVTAVVVGMWGLVVAAQPQHR